MEHDMYREWYHTAGFRQDGVVYDQINACLQEYRTSIGHEKTRGRIAAQVIQVLTQRNGLVERWPLTIRCQLNQSSSSEPRPCRPFETWARPRDIEKRKQAISVWYSLLNFLVFHWHNYGADGRFESMGLRMSHRFKDLIDTIKIYSDMNRVIRKPMREAIEEIFMAAITDANATANTNPLLWWLAVIIQTEVLGNQSRLEVDDRLDFLGKLEAIDHYSRALVLNFAFNSWLGEKGTSQADKEKVIRALDSVSLDWVDQDQEPQINPMDNSEMVNSQAWQSCSSYINAIFDRWLTDHSSGPICDVTKLRRRTLAPPVEQVTRYCVKMEIYEDFTLDPCIADCYPAYITKKPTVELANTAARKALEDELGPREDAYMWNEAVGSDGMIRIRAVYLDDANNAKAITWVERELVDKLTNENEMDFMDDDMSSP
jgi:hypothetical protein